MTGPAMPGAPDQVQAMLADVGRHWGSVLTFGLLSILLGIAAITWPGQTVVAVAIFFAAQLFVSGIFSVVQAFDAQTDTGARVLSAIIGVLGIIVGLALLKAPFQSVVVMAFVIGVYWTAHGIVALVAAFSRTDGRTWRLFIGILSVLAGIVIVQYPMTSLATLAWVVGIWLVILGALQVVVAYQLREIARAAAPG